MDSRQVRDKSVHAAQVDRLVRLASTPLLHPNERCAGVTIALALLVCPDEVSAAPSEFDRADDLQYRNVKVSLPRDTDSPKGGFEFFSWAAARPSLPNLGASPEDYENDIEARELLGYYPLCETGEARAALLTLVWICLVEGHPEVRKLVNGSFVLAAERYGVELVFDGLPPSNVVKACYAPPAPRASASVKMRAH